MAAFFTFCLGVPMRSSTLTVWTVLLVGSGNALVGQQHGAIVIGTSLTIESTVLLESREILVSLPVDYEADSTSYPVIVVLDGETHFVHTVGLVRFLSHRFVRQVPRAIVVGVPNTDRLRDVTPTATERFPNGGGVSRFLDFLDEELLPLVDREFRTSGRPVLMGHSGSGLAVLYAMMRFSDRFRAYVALDPSLDWDGGVTVRELDEFLTRSESLPVFLTFGSYKPKPETGMLVASLERTARAGVWWSAPIYDGETHNSMVHRGFSDALRAAFTEGPDQTGNR